MTPRPGEIKFTEEQMKAARSSHNRAGQGQGSEPLANKKSKEFEVPLTPKQKKITAASKLNFFAFDSTLNNKSSSELESYFNSVKEEVAVLLGKDINNLPTYIESLKANDRLRSTWSSAEERIRVKKVKEEVARKRRSNKQKNVESLVSAQINNLIRRLEEVKLSASFYLGRLPRNYNDLIQSLENDKYDDVIRFLGAEDYRDFEESYEGILSNEDADWKLDNLDLVQRKFDSLKEQNEDLVEQYRGSVQSIESEFNSIKNKNLAEQLVAEFNGILGGINDIFNKDTPPYNDMSLSDAYDFFQNNLDSKRNELEKIKREADRKAKEEAAKIAQEKADFETKLSQQKEQNDSALATLKAQYEAEMERKEAENKQALADAQKQAEEEKQKAVADAESRARQEGQNALDEANKKAQDEKNKLQAQHQQALADIQNQAKEEKGRLQAAHAAELQAERDKYDKLAKAAGDTNATVGALNEQIEGLKREKQEETNRAVELQEQLQQQSSDYQQALEEAERKAKEERSELQTVHEEALAKQKNEFEKQLKDLGEQNNTAQGELVARHNEALKSLRNQLAESSGENDALKNELKTLQDSLNEEISQKERALEEKARLETELEQAGQEAAKASEKAQNDLTERDNAIKDLQGQLTALSNADEGLKNTLEQLSAANEELSTTKSEKEALEQQLEALKAESEVKVVPEVKAAAVGGDLTFEQSIQTDVDGEYIENLEKEIAKLKGQLSLAEQENANLEKENQRLRGEEVAIQTPEGFATPKPEMPNTTGKMSGGVDGVLVPLVPEINSQEYGMLVSGLGETKICQHEYSKVYKVNFPENLSQYAMVERKGEVIESKIAMDVDGLDVKEDGSVVGIDLTKPNTADIKRKVVDNQQTQIFINQANLEKGVVLNVYMADGFCVRYRANDDGELELYNPPVARSIGDGKYEEIKTQDSGTTKELGEALSKVQILLGESLKISKDLEKDARIKSAIWREYLKLPEKPKEEQSLKLKKDTTMSAMKTGGRDGRPANMVDKPRDVSSDTGVPLMV